MTADKCWYYVLAIRNPEGTYCPIPGYYLAAENAANKVKKLRESFAKIRDLRYYEVVVTTLGMEV